jgi:hypothetical protein
MVIKDRLGLGYRNRNDQVLNHNTVRLFVLAKAPENFSAQSQGLTPQDSYVLYDLEAPIP